jgi:hypothetical protein
VTCRFAMTRHYGVIANASHPLIHHHRSGGGAALGRAPAAVAGAHLAPAACERLRLPLVGLLRTGRQAGVPLASLPATRFASARRTYVCALRPPAAPSARARACCGQGAS